MSLLRALPGFVCAIAITLGSVGVASAQRILVYGPGGTLATSSFPAGARVTVANAATWASLTRAEFESYDAIWIDSNNCSLDPTVFDVARANRDVWGAAAIGRAVVTGADLDFHSSASASLRQLIRQIAAWIGERGSSAEGGATGLFLSFGCTMQTSGPTTTSSPPVDILDPFGTFTVAGGRDEPNSVAPHPITTGLTAVSLSVSYFAHASITSFPSGWASVVRRNELNLVIVRNDCPLVTLPGSGFTVAEGGSASLTATTSASAAALRWDLNGDGTFETAGNPVTFSAAGLDGPSVHPIAVRTTGACAAVTDSSGVFVVNVDPVVTSTPPVTVTAGTTLTYAITATDAAGALDPLTFVPTMGPLGSSVEGSSGVLTWTPELAVAGTTVPFVITVSDGDGGTAVHSFSVGVTCPDADSDGVPDGRCPGESDCDDGNASIFPGAPELCDEIDQDCDGAVANGFMVGTACSVGVGTCAASGALVCDTTTTTRCSAVPGAPGTESCNGLDDDCNGTLDDGGDDLCAASADGAVCLAAGMLAACGCAAAADCGEPTSGRICDLGTSTCVDGCGVGDDRNGCPAGQFCTSMDPSTDGVCTTTCNFDEDCASDRVCDTASGVCVDRPAPDAGTPDASVGDAGVGGGADASMGGAAGGGCGCSAPGADHHGSLATVGLLALALTILRRRVRR